MYIIIITPGFRKGGVEREGFGVPNETFKREATEIPKRNLTYFGECFFSFIPASIWNSLPANL